MTSRFFIDRPIFAAVISIVVTVVGLVALLRLPVDRYPQITPPTVQVTASYIGASAEVVEQTVATPIEQQLNGVENLLYYDSTSTNDGQVVITATFEVGTNLDIAAVQVQNAVARAEPQLPEEVVRAGLSINKQSTSLLMVISLTSPGGVYDDLFLSNYTKINLRDALLRLPGVGGVQMPGEREYGMRFWLRPDALPAGADGFRRDQRYPEQNRQARPDASHRPARPASRLIHRQRQGPAQRPGRVRRHHHHGPPRRLAGAGPRRGPRRTGAFGLSSFARLNGRDTSSMIVFQLPGSERAGDRRRRRGR